MALHSTALNHSACERLEAQEREHCWAREAWFYKHCIDFSGTW